MLTDSHCHLASHKFPREEVPELIQRASEAGVSKLVTLATCLDDMPANLEIASAHSEVRCCLGIHPCDVQSAPDDVMSQLEPLLDDPKVCAIGETGLDYYHPAPDGWDDTSYHKRQQELMDAHFELAAEKKLNVVIHTRDRKGDASFQDALSIYKKHSHHVRAIFHCFIGPEDNAKAVLDLGGLVSFGGVATFKNAGDVLNVAATLPADSFLLETDSPYLSPHPYRGKRNEPSRVRVIAEAIAVERRVTVEKLAEDSTKAAMDFFRWIE